MSETKKKVTLSVRVGSLGRSCSVDVDPSLDTADTNKDLVSEKAGILPEQQRLFYCGVLLEHERNLGGEGGQSVLMTLADYGIGSEATIASSSPVVELMPRLPESQFKISIKAVKTDNSSQTVEVNVNSTDTVRSVKQRVPTQTTNASSTRGEDRPTTFKMTRS